MFVGDIPLSSLPVGISLNKKKHAKFARAKIFQTLQSMDPTIIESHTGMKVLTNEEYTQLQTNLDKSKSEARQINAQVQLKFAKLLETTTAVEKMKKNIEELKKAIEEKEKEDADAAKPEKKETKVADAAKPEEKELADAAAESVLEEKETKAADSSKPIIEEKDTKAADAVVSTTDEKSAANNDDAKVAETKQ